MAEQLKFGDRLFLKGEKVLFDNGTEDAIIESRNGTLVIKGNLTVEGTTTTLDTASTVVSDPFILLNGDHTGTASEDVGIEIERGTDTNVKFGWDETNDRWSTFGELFYSNNIEADTIVANTSISGPLISSNVTITGGNIDGTVIGATNPVQAYFTDIHGDGTNITNVLTNYTTDNLTEGSSNLYFTDERVDDRISNLFNASYGISALYTDPANTFEISFDAKNIGNTVDETPKPNSVKILDDINQNFEARFRTLVTGPNLDITVTEDSNEIVIDTAVKINNLEFNTFTGTGSVSQFTLPYTVSQDWQVLVYIDGVVQEPTTSYTMSGNTLTLSAPLALSSVMNVIKMASNTVASTVTDADTLNTFAGSYYLDYNNFTNTPTIPTVPTNVSAFTNDSGYITNADIPTNHMVNDASNTVAGSISPSVDATHDLGTATEQWNTIYGHTVEATYADLAERYAADAPYEPGTVLVFGGEAEVTTTRMLADTKVVGIVSTDPALKMNSAAGNSQTHPYIALKGRVPCKVIGKIEKGDLLVTSSTPGHAKASLGVPMIGTVIGKAIEAKSGTGEGIIEVFVSIM